MVSLQLFSEQLYSSSMENLLFSSFFFFFFCLLHLNTYPRSARDFQQYSVIIFFFVSRLLFLMEWFFLFFICLFITFLTLRHAAMCLQRFCLVYFSLSVLFLFSIPFWSNDLHRTINMNHVTQLVLLAAILFCVVHSLHFHLPFFCVCLYVFHYTRSFLVSISPVWKKAYSIL